MAGTKMKEWEIIREINQPHQCMDGNINWRCWKPYFYIYNYDISYIKYTAIRKFRKQTKQKYYIT